MSPSRLHSYLEGKFAAALALFPQFMTYINLTLDIGGVDYIPCLGLSAAAGQFLCARFDSHG